MVSGLVVGDHLGFGFELWFWVQVLVVVSV